MTELHIFIQAFEREDNKVWIEVVDEHYEVYVTTPYHQIIKFEFDKQGIFERMFQTPL